MAAEKATNNTSDIVKDTNIQTIEDPNDIKQWFDDRCWSVSGNKKDLLASSSNQHPAAFVVFPKSTKDVSNILSTFSPTTKVAVVCGGHSSSNVATWAGPNAVIIDMRNMSSVHVDKDKMEVTVGGGTTFRPLAEAVAQADGALPIGTGDSVGVCGYVLNGGISGYFGRRLGMLGQRVVELTILC